MAPLLARCYGIVTEYPSGFCPALTTDAANRMLAADHYTNSSGSWTFTNNYTESGITYDLNGNIKSYTRRGLTSGTSTFGNIDQLAYHFDDVARPDRLTRVVDAASSTKGFKYNTSATSPHYSYDLNGNLTLDKHKDLSFSYNHLNLPNYIFPPRLVFRLAWSPLPPRLCLLTKRTRVWRSKKHPTHQPPTLHPPQNQLQQLGGHLRPGL
ncbi:MAG: hypothetical protein KIS77_04995 [Saprospiraceae bacterium]|nr:hypothetical protein [Saprospiraceae bacterium]